MCAIEITPVLSTERLVLRGPVNADAERLCDLLNDRDVAGKTSNIPHPYRPQDAETFVERAQAADWDEEAHFAIEHRHFGLVGGLALRPGFNNRSELGFWLGRRFWNRGYATEATRAALRWAKREWRKKLIVAGHFADNPASGQVLCKAGFLYTGDIQMRRSAARGHEVPVRMMVWLA